MRCQKMEQQVQVSSVILRMFSQRQFMPCRQPLSGWQKEKARSTSIICTRSFSSQPRDLLASRQIISVCSVNSGTQLIMRVQTDLLKGGLQTLRYSFSLILLKSDSFCQNIRYLLSTFSLRVTLHRLFTSINWNKLASRGRNFTHFLTASSAFCCRVLRDLWFSSSLALRMRWLELTLLVVIILFMQWYSSSFLTFSLEMPNLVACTSMKSKMKVSQTCILAMQQLISQMISYIFESWITFSLRIFFYAKVLLLTQVDLLNNLCSRSLLLGSNSSAFPLALVLLINSMIFCQSAAFLQNSSCFPSSLMRYWSLCLTLEEMQRRLQRMPSLFSTSTIMAKMYFIIVASSLNLELLSFVSVQRLPFNLLRKQCVHRIYSRMRVRDSQNLRSSYLKLERLVKKPTKSSIRNFYFQSAYEETSSQISVSPIYQKMINFPSLSRISSFSPIEKVSFSQYISSYSCSDSSTEVELTSRLMSLTIDICIFRVKLQRMELWESISCRICWQDRFIYCHFMLHFYIYVSTISFSNCFSESVLVSELSLSMKFLLSYLSSSLLLWISYSISSEALMVSLWLFSWLSRKIFKGSMTSTSIFLLIIPIFLESSLRMSMMYLLRKMMLSSSVSSTFNFLKKRRQALVSSRVKPPKSQTMLTAKLRISEVRSSLHRDLLVRISWKSVPSWMSNSPIQIIINWCMQRG